MQPCVVDLPEAEFIACHELALAVAHAKVPADHQEQLAESSSQGSRTPPSYAKLTEDAPDAPDAPLKQVGESQARQPLLENSSNVWRPLASEHLLVECARRLADLQAWVVRKELSIFTASHTKAQVVAPGAYLRRADAIRYCEESGLEVWGRAQPVAPMRPPTGAQAPVETLTRSPEPSEAGLPGDIGKKRQPQASPASPTYKAGTRLLRPKEAIARTGLSRSSFYERQNPKSRYFDATFPSPVQIGQSARGYREDELDAWIASRVVARR